MKKFRINVVSFVFAMLFVFVCLATSQSTFGQYVQALERQMESLGVSYMKNPLTQDFLKAHREAVESCRGKTCMNEKTFNRLDNLLENVARIQSRQSAQIMYGPGRTDYIGQCYRRGQMDVLSRNVNQALYEISQAQRNTMIHCIQNGCPCSKLHQFHLNQR